MIGLHKKNINKNMEKNNNNIKNSCINGLILCIIDKIINFIRREITSA